ncbi:helix-hairpin-helix domain-containing protein [Gemelliphila palaticanis]|uniref:Helix-hairpin-helix domain-containing protein n=1 Tax=Gemelliphila palaticanis TaxID=81950 RepID=A0ABX2SY30_9BACL|nr:helix-hairpin-helix domain-containing protein [Gemella palaticanis]MBF0715262.1 helix-hairpin-helix domain-containing protein [Gemella palaticanis]NYS47192.1 helix-hairpin-helix domain-containing protein [Gemella palaticanis]
MKWSKEEILVFLKQNLFTILLSIATSIVIVVGILFFINYNKVEEKDYSQINNQISEVKVDSKEEEKQIPEKIFIDIKGAVNNPGVYEFTKDDRIKDAVEKAGGTLADADLTTINLSQKLKDQMLIVIPKVGEKVDSNSSSNSNQNTININLATKEELMKITGVGETKAKAIIDYRENKGEFKKKEDITKVKGIGKGTFEKIKDEIDV